MTEMPSWEPWGALFRRGDDGQQAIRTRSVEICDHSHSGFVEPSAPEMAAVVGLKTCTKSIWSQCCPCFPALSHTSSILFVFPPLPRPVCFALSNIDGFLKPPWTSRSYIPLAGQRLALIYYSPIRRVFALSKAVPLSVLLSCLSKSNKGTLPTRAKTCLHRPTMAVTCHGRSFVEMFWVLIASRSWTPRPCKACSQSHS